jgi:hypothetical protein
MPLRFVQVLNNLVNVKSFGFLNPSLEEEDTADC